MIRTVPDRLNAEIKLMVQQELLGQEALSRGLDDVPAVRQQLEMWHNAYLADMVREYVRKHVAVSDAEVYAYLNRRILQSLFRQSKYVNCGRAPSEK